MELATLIEAGRGHRRIHLLGHRDDLPSLIASADSCIHAARNEGLPRVVLQYALGGKPIIATNLPGIECVVRSDVNGSLVPVDEPRQVSHEFLKLACDKARQQKFARASLALDLSAWATERMVQRIQDIYLDVLGGAPGSSVDGSGCFAARSSSASV